MSQFLPGYRLRSGSGLDRAMLVKFSQLTYRELYPDLDFSHLARTVEHYFSNQSHLWWVELAPEPLQPVSQKLTPQKPILQKPILQKPIPQKIPYQPVACLWMGNATDQVTGKSHSYILLLYVMPEQRRQGIGSALMRYAEAWARNRGDHQLGLQVFQSNQPAIALYNKLGFQVQSLWMIKPLQ